MCKELISIIVPIYNVQNYIARCAHSLFTQNYSDIEFIFVNDCSSDDSMKILRSVINSYPDRLHNTKIVEHQYNRGLAAARNTGLSVATGTYVLHVDSDDYIEPRTVSAIIEKAVETNADMVGFDICHISPNYSMVEHNIPVYNIEAYIQKLIRRECIVCLCGTLIRRSLYVDNEIYAVEGVNMGEDYYTKPRLAFYAQKIEVVNKPFYNYIHLNADSYTSKFNNQIVAQLTKAIDILEMFFKERNVYEVFSKDFDFAKNQIKAELLLSWALRSGSIKDFIKLKQVYSGTKKNNDIKFSNKIILLLSNLNFPRLLRIYAVVGYRFKQLIKASIKVFK